MTKGVNVDVRWSRRVLPWVVLALTVVIAYGGAVRNGFLYDDYHLIAENPAVVSHDWWAVWTSPDATSKDPQGRGFRPVTLSSYVVDHLVGGGRPSVLHAAQIVWHVLTVGLTFLVASALGLHRITAFAVAILVGFHPMQTEAVHYLSARSSVLSTLWLLASFGAYLRWRADPATRGWWRAASLMGLALAVLSKESAIAGLVWFVAWERLVGRATWSAAGRRLWPHAAVAAASVAPAVFIVDASTHGTPVPATVAVAAGLAAVGRHLTAWIAPWAVDPLWPIGWVGWASPIVWCGAGVLVGLGVMAYVLRRRTPVGAWGLVCGITGLLPVLALPFVTTVAWFQPHRGYQAAVGFALAFGAFAEPLARRLVAAAGSATARRILRVSASAAGVALVVGAIAVDVGAGRLWRDEIGFWTWAVGRYPREAAYHHSLGAARLRHGDPAAAIEALVAAAGLDASLPRVDFNIGLAYTKLGRYDEALAAYERAVVRDSGDVKSLANMGALYERRGELERAALAYRAALAVEPRLRAVGARLRVIETSRAARGGPEPPTAVGP